MTAKHKKQLHTPIPSDVAARIARMTEVRDRIAARKAVALKILSKPKRK